MTRRVTAACGVVLVALSVLVFGPSLGHDFVWDDHDLIEANPMVTSPGLGHRLPFFFLSGFASSPFSTETSMYYRPLTVLSLAHDYWIWGPNPTGFHLTNVLLHLGVSLVVLLFLIETGVSRGWALLGTGLFLLHPVHSEAVLWVSGRTDLLAALFFLLGYFLYLRVLKTERRLALLSAGVLISYLLAILGKEMALTFPAVLLLHYLLSRSQSTGQSDHRTGKNNWRVWLPVGGTSAIAILYMLFRHSALRSIAGGAVTAPPLPERLLAAPVILAKSMSLSLLPWHLSPVRPAPGVSSVSDPVFLVSVLYLATAAAVLWLARNRLRRLIPPAVFFLVTMIPVLGFVPIVVPFAERFLYLPSFGVVWMLVELGQILVSGQERAGRPVPRPGAIRRRATQVVFLVLGLLFASKSQAQLAVWRDDVNLFSRILEEHPNSVPALNELGGALARRGETSRAREVLTRAASLAPNSAPIHYNLSRVLEQLGDTGNAIRELKRTLEISPDAPRVPRHLTRLLTGAGRKEEALSILKGASRRGSAEAAQILREIQQKNPGKEVLE